MSLINEALKKAQERHGKADTSAPAGGAPTAHPVPPRQVGTGAPSLWTLVGIFCVIAIVFGAGSSMIIWGLLGGSSEDAEATAPATNESRAVAVPTPAAEPSAATSPIARAQGVVAENDARAALANEVMDAGLAQSAAPAPSRASASGSPEASAGPSGTGSATTAAAERAAVVEASTTSAQPAEADPNPAVVEYLNQIEIRGIMMGGRRVLIYDRGLAQSKAYEVGSVINNELGVRVQQIEGTSITFSDHAGASYIKYF